jgi:hypothetical protein
MSRLDKFDRAVARWGDIASIISLWLTLVGLVGGLLQRVLKFSPFWRAMTIVGFIGLVAVTFAILIVTVRRWLLTRSEGESSIPQSKPEGSTMFHFGAGADDNLLLGNLARNVGTFLKADGPITRLTAPGNVHDNAKRKSGQSRRPIVLDEQHRQQFSEDCLSTSQDILRFLTQRRADQMNLIMSSHHQESEELRTKARSQIPAQFMETVSLYHERFAGRVVALGQIAMDNGFDDGGILQQHDMAVNDTAIRGVAERLGAVAYLASRQNGA